MNKTRRLSSAVLLLGLSALVSAPAFAQQASQELSSESVIEEIKKVTNSLKTWA